MRQSPSGGSGSSHPMAIDPNAPEFIPAQHQGGSSFQRSMSLNVNAPEYTPAAGGGSGDSVLGNNEVLVGSGKYSQPSKIPGKMLFKDEVVIRNADSGRGNDKRLFFPKKIIDRFHFDSAAKQPVVLIFSYGCEREKGSHYRGD